MITCNIFSDSFPENLSGTGLTAGVVSSGLQFAEQFMQM